MYLKNQKGQNLIEIVVMLGVLMVVLSSVVIVTVNGLKNSQFAKNQLLATKLAQEGIDNIKLAKSKNCQITFNSTNYNWYDSNTIWAVSIMAETAYSVNLNNNPCMVTGNDSISGGFTQFTRSISLIDYGSTSTKRVTSEVKWNDFSGTHSSKIVTLISNN